MENDFTLVNDGYNYQDRLTSNQFCVELSSSVWECMQQPEQIALSSDNIAPPPTEKLTDADLKMIEDTISSIRKNNDIGDKSFDRIAQLLRDENTAYAEKIIKAINHGLPENLEFRIHSHHKNLAHIAVPGAYAYRLDTSLVLIDQNKAAEQIKQDPLYWAPELSSGTPLGLVADWRVRTITASGNRQEPGSHDKTIKDYKYSPGKY